MSIQPFGSVTSDSLVDETAKDNGDPVYTKQRLEQMSQHRVRNLAAEASTDLINGKSPKLLVFAYYACLDETAISNGDLKFTKDELDAMSENMLSKLAAVANTNTITAESKPETIKSYFTTQRSLTEFSD